MVKMFELLEEVEKKGLRDIPFKDLTSDEIDLVVTADVIEDILKDSEFEDTISLREYSHYWGGKEYSPSKLLTLVKPYLEEINKELAKKGFVRMSKFTWRKFVITIDEKKLEELAKRLGLGNDEAYILAVAYKLLKITVPFVKDWKGYNLVDGLKVLSIFEKLSCEEKITEKDIEYIRKKLLKYEEQIKGLGLDFERIKRDGKVDSDG